MIALNGNEDCAWRNKQFAQPWMSRAASILSYGKVQRKWTHCHVQTLYEPIFFVYKITSLVHFHTVSPITYANRRCMNEGKRESRHTSFTFIYQCCRAASLPGDVIQTRKYKLIRCLMLLNCLDGGSHLFIVTMTLHNQRKCYKMCAECLWG